MFPAIGYAGVNAITPSTNYINRNNGWAHVNRLSKDIGEVTLKFVQPRDFYACFEYRTDGDTSQASGTNYNTDITDGLYPYFCLSTISSITKTIQANEYVEIRMVFGGERDERFDWTKFVVLPIPDTTAPDVKITAPTTYLLSGIVEIWGSIVDDNPHHYWLVVVNSEGSKVAGPGTVNETNSLTDVSLWSWESIKKKNLLRVLRVNSDISNFGTFAV
ncbi:unnamed protein product [marine sediment metagenome]|uniref:Uncharacterized protein n=1 Tax=marine sediment metagenome TaxID=412755 RepID=X1A460_9ZZZZ